MNIIRGLKPWRVVLGVWCVIGTVQGCPLSETNKKAVPVPQFVLIASSDWCAKKSLTELLQENPYKSAILIYDELNNSYYTFTDEHKKQLQDNKNCHCVFVSEGDKQAVYLIPLRDAVNKYSFAHSLQKGLEGNGEWLNELGHIYLCGMYHFPQSSERGLYWLLAAAEKGNTDSYYWIARGYIRGEGVAKDTKKGVEWFSKGAACNNVGCRLGLAYCYENGIGTEKDEKKALDMFLQLANEGCAEAEYKVGWFYEDEDNEEAVRWFKKAAEAGYAEAQHSLGMCLEIGQGIEKNEKEAAMWYLKAAQQDDIGASLHVGLCYLEGCGIEKNEPEGVKWLTIAAEAELEEAQISLGTCFEEGRGVEKNPQQAFVWYKAAADQGFPAAYGEVARCYEHGIGVEKDLTKAREYSNKYKKSNPDEVPHFAYL